MEKRKKKHLVYTGAEIFQNAIIMHNTVGDTKTLKARKKQDMQARRDV